MIDKSLKGSTLATTGPSQDICTVFDEISLTVKLFGFPGVTAKIKKIIFISIRRLYKKKQFM